jgi:hypothetical protein
VTGELFGGLHDFFHSTTWDVIRAAAALFVVLFWIATVFWVWKDARRRIGNKGLVALATLLGLCLPFLGPIVYMLFRPPEYLDDVRERELQPAARAGVAGVPVLRDAGRRRREDGPAPPAGGAPPAPDPPLRLLAVE